MAYIGPGLATGTIGVILGVVGSICIAVFAMLWYPIKRALKKFKKSSPKENRRPPE
jgi:preprotein translocase subunit SecF